MPVPNNFKESLVIDYKIKDLEEVKIIIKWQIARDLSTELLESANWHISKICLKKNLINCKAPNILIKVNSFIKINKQDNYDKVNL